LRIIAGTARGRRLFAPAKTRNPLIRPTADRAREAIFSIIGNRVVSAHVLDLFAGTGALGLEALSRGAESAVFVDRLPSAIALVRKNLGICGFLERASVVRADLTKGLALLKSWRPPGGFSLVFLDPPYGGGLGEKILAGLNEASLVGENGIVVAEDEAKERYPASINDLLLSDQRHYGETGFWLYRCRKEKNGDDDRV